MFGVKRPRDEDLESDLDIHRKIQKCSSGWHPTTLTTEPSNLQSFPLQPPTLTPVNSCDEDEYFSATKPNMVPSKGVEECHLPTEWNSVSSTPNHATVKPLAALPGSWSWPDNSNSNPTQSLPAISDQEFNRSLRINENPTTYALHPHPPTAMPLSDAVMKDTNSMEYAGHMAEEHCFIPARLPSPVSDNGDVTMSGSALNEAGQISYVRPSPQSTVPEIPMVRPLSPRHEDEATLVSQAQPRKKPTLIMGYRASCEKCRNKVPGHYSHLIL